MNNRINYCPYFMVIKSIITRLSGNMDDLADFKTLFKMIWV